MTESLMNVGTADPGIIQFENANEGRSYPFDDNAVLTTSDGKTLPDSVIADLHLVIPCGNEAYLSSVYLSANMISLCLKTFKNSLFSAALSVTVTKDDFEPYMPYRLEKLTGSEDVGGIVTFGNVTFGEGTGVYRYADKTVRVVYSAQSRYVPSGLRKFIDDRTGESLSGDVKILFSNYIETLRNEEKISLNLKSGAAKILASDCDHNRPVNACGATPVTSINGVSPDDQKRIVLWFH